MMGKINEYFFGEEKIAFSDGLFFYGFIGFVAIMSVLIAGVKIFN